MLKERRVGEKLGEGKDGGGKCGLYIWGFGSKIS